MHRSHPLLVGHVVALLDVVLLAPFLRDLFNLSLHARELGVLVFAVVLSSPRKMHNSIERGEGGEETADFSVKLRSPLRYPIERRRECRVFFSEGFGR